MELKPCPFCGGAVKIDRQYKSLNPAVTFNFQWLIIKHIEKDSDCGAYIEGEIFSEPISPKELEYEEIKLVSKWNRRVNDE